MPKTSLLPSLSLSRAPNCAWPQPTSRMRRLLAGTALNKASMQRRLSFSRLSLVHIRIRAQVLQNFLAVFFVNHQIDALTAVAALDAALGAHKMLSIPLPVRHAGCGANPAQFLLALGPQPFQELVLQRQEELATTGVALPPGAAGQLPVDAPRV